MQRRDFLKGTAGAAASAWPLGARAQQTIGVFRIGVLGVSRDAPGMAEGLRDFSNELAKNGFSEGQNLSIEYRRIDDPRGVSVAAAEPLHARLGLIVAQGPEVVLQAIGASHIQAINFDPVARGYVASLARPGGNRLFYQEADLAAKKVELLARALPERKNLGVLWGALVTYELARRAAKALRLDFHA